MESFIKSLRPYTKSIIAGIIGVLNVLQLYVQLSPDGITADELGSLIGAAILLLGGTAAVYQFPNKKE